MSVPLLIAGVLLIVLTALDALWTTLWVDGHGGPLTSRHNSLTRNLTWRLVPRRNHRLLSLTGPLVLVSSVLAWALLLWAGWVTLFSADPGSLLHAHTGAPATLADRIYFTGYTMFTMGNGDFSPQGSGWKLATSVSSLSGLFVVTLAVTYLLSVLQAVVAKRSFASHVMALGHSAEELVVSAWDRGGFPGLELQIVSITEQLNLISEQHDAYPMLHYYHDADMEKSVSRALAIFDDAMLLLAHAVRPEHRPAASALRGARESVREFLESLASAHVDASEASPPSPDLTHLRAAGIPTIPDDEFLAALREREKLRRLLKGFLDGEKRDWPCERRRR